MALSTVTFLLSLTLVSAATPGFADDYASMIQKQSAKTQAETLAAGRKVDNDMGAVHSKATRALSLIEEGADELWSSSLDIKRDLRWWADHDDEEDEQLPTILGKVSDALHLSLDGWGRLRSTMEDGAVNISAALSLAGQEEVAKHLKESLDNSVGPVMSFMQSIQEARDHAHLGQMKQKPGRARAEEPVFVKKIRNMNTVLHQGLNQLVRFSKEFENAFTELVKLDEKFGSESASLLAIDNDISFKATHQTSRAVAKKIINSAKILVGGVILATHYAAPESLVKTNKDEPDITFVPEEEDALATTAEPGAKTTTAPEEDIFDEEAGNATKAPEEEVAATTVEPETDSDSSNESKDAKESPSKDGAAPRGAAALAFLLAIAAFFSQ